MLKHWLLAGLILMGISLSASGQSLDLRDPVIEADLLAVETLGQLTPSEPLANQIQWDLAAIRSTYPALADIRTRPSWMPGELLVGLLPSSFDQYQNGTFTGFDSLFASLGEPSVRTNSFQPSLALDFGRVYHGERLAELFDDVEGVTYAVANYTIGDGDDIVVGPNRTYTLSRGSGDCPSGCIFRESWIISVTDDSISSSPQLPLGDYDLDGDFDGADFLGWQGMTDVSVGMGAWLENYGQESPLNGLVQVPEPSGLAAIQVALFGFLSCRNGKLRN